MKKQNSILLATSIDALGLARLPSVFAKGGIAVTVACGAGLAITKSRFVANHVRTGRAPQQVREGLEEHISRFPDLYDRVVIADEPVIRAFLGSPATPALSALAPLLADPEHLTWSLSKVSFTAGAEKAGIPIPAFRVLDGREDLSESSWATLPFVAKGEESMSGSGVRLIHTRAEVEDARISMSSGPIIVQDYVRGQVGATAVLFGKGKPLCWFSYFLRDNWPNPLASASTLELCWHPQVEPVVNQLGALTGFDGLCGIDWILDPRTNNLLVLEMNMRPTPGIYLAHHAGVSFSSALADWMQHGELIQKPMEKPQHSCRLFPQHLHWAIDRRDPLGFLRTFEGAPWQDPQLLLAQTRRVLTHYAPMSLRNGLRSAATR